MHFGKKSSTKTYGYVGNAVYQIKQLLFTDTTESIPEKRVFYIGDEPAYNIEEWANDIAEIAGKKIPRIPFWMIKSAALCGDVLKKVHVDFPMTSFRLKNMITDNIINLDLIKEIAPNPPYTRKEASEKTMLWIKGQD